jgi:sugar phosphate isomerase/epimerase
VDVPTMLVKEGLSGYFEAVILSCMEGRRKPSAEVLLAAVKRMGVRPEECAYVGNLPERDVAAARNAGFRQAIILRDPANPADTRVEPENKPDYFIDDLADLLKIYPPRDAKVVVSGTTQYYAISLSTMWGIRKFDQLGDFLLAAARLGFSGVELNHQVNPSMLEGVDLNRFPVTSIHEPCPAVISADTLKKKDILISSPDEERRKQGVESIRRSIDLAKNLGVTAIVIHAGMVQVDPTWEKQLIALFNAGKKDTAEYQEIKHDMEAARARMVEPCLKAVEKSLRELLEYAGKLGIRLGLENRYHYYDIPSPEEMAHFLNLADADRLGFIYDTGHAHAMDQLGFYNQEDWLMRFADRIIVTHLHDAIGVEDHQTPGLGEIDFRMVAAYLPQAALRTMEVQPHHNYEQIRQGIKYLVDTGCVHPFKE